MKSTIKSEDAPTYGVEPDGNGDLVIAAALEILRKRLAIPGQCLTSPDSAANYLTLKLAALEYEVFGMLLLDNRHCVIADEPLFRGTINGAAVYPREVVKSALAHNAAAVIFYHNHPSGNPEPSRADEALTRTLKNALDILEIRVLDHLLIAGNQHKSFSALGLL